MCILIQVKRKSFAGYIESRKSKRKDSTILSTTSYFDPIYDILESGKGQKLPQHLQRVTTRSMIYYRFFSGAVNDTLTVPPDASGAPLLTLKF